MISSPSFSIDNIDLSFWELMASPAARNIKKNWIDPGDKLECNTNLSE